MQPNILSVPTATAAPKNTKTIFMDLQADRAKLDNEYKGVRKRSLLANIREAQAFYKVGGFDDPYLSNLAKLAGLPTEDNPPWVFACLVGGFDPTMPPSERRKRRKLASEDGAFIKALSDQLGVEALIASDVEEILAKVEVVGGKTGFTRKQKVAKPLEDNEGPDTSAEAVAAILERASQAPSFGTLDAGSLSMPLPARATEAVVIVEDDGTISVKLVLAQDPRTTLARLLPLDVKQIDPAVRFIGETLNLARVVPEGMSQIPRDLGADTCIEGVATLPALRQFLWIDGKLHVSQARVDIPTVTFEATPLDGRYFPSTPSFIESRSRRHAEEGLAPVKCQGSLTCKGLIIGGKQKHPVLWFAPVKGSAVKSIVLSLPAIADAFGSSKVSDMWAFRLDETAFKPVSNHTVDQAEFERLSRSFINPNLTKAQDKDAHVKVSGATVSIKVGTSEPVILSATAIDSSRDTSINVAAGDLIAVLVALLRLAPANLVFTIDPGGLLALACTTDFAHFRVFLPKVTKQDKVITRTHGDRLRRVTRYAI